MNEQELSGLSIDSVERGEFDVEKFDHEAHVFAAWRFIDELPLPEAIERFSNALRRLTARLGVPGKYHDTVTWFYMLLIAERHQAGEDWPSFREANEDLFASDVLSRYYTRECLASEAARQRFVLPDRIAA